MNISGGEFLGCPVEDSDLRMEGTRIELDGDVVQHAGAWLV